MSFEISQIRHVICGSELILTQMFSSDQCLKMVSLFLEPGFGTVVRGFLADKLPSKYCFSCRGWFDAAKP